MSTDHFEEVPTINIPGHKAMGQNQTTRGPQILVLGSILQGKPFWAFGVPIFDPHLYNKCWIPQDRFRLWLSRLMLSTHLPVTKRL